MARRGRRRRPGWADGGRSGRPWRRNGHRLRANADGRPQVPAGGPRRAQPDPQRGDGGLSGTLWSGGASTSCSHRSFSADALRAWSEALGQQTFVGSSGRVFPKAMKTSPLLRAWLRRLGATGVRFKPRHRWTGWDADGRLMFSSQEGDVAVKPMRRCWRWAAQAGLNWGPMAVGPDRFRRRRPRDAAATGQLRLSRRSGRDIFRTRFAGQPLKRLELSFGGQKVRGEAIITETGLEGGGIYALAAPLREAIVDTGEAILHVDLRPDVDARRAGNASRCASRQTIALHLPAQGGKPISCGDRAAARSGGGVFPAPVGDGTGCARRPRQGCAHPLTGTAPIARAISTAGGIAFDEIDGSFMLRRRPGVFVAGEMLDWEAPTGGYLLQACFATGAAAGQARWPGSPERARTRFELSRGWAIPSPKRLTTSAYAEVISPEPRLGGELQRVFAVWDSST